MRNDFIEKKVENFRFLWGYAPEGTLKQKKGVELETVFRKGLQEALLKGLEEGRLKQSNELLRSAYQIALRDGKETGWEAFRTRLKEELDIQHGIMYPALKKEVMEGREV